MAMIERSATPRPAKGGRGPQTLAERFWSIAKGMEAPAPETEAGDPIAAVRHVLAVLDAFERPDATGPQVSAHTLSFLMLLRQQEMLGDLLYASPEQARGESVDERSLVFSVGVLLFERLTGRHPFGAEGNPRRMARIRRGELGSGVNFFPVVPAGLRHILLKAMGPFPEERWSSMGELRTQLEQFQGEASRGRRREDDEPTRVMPRRPPEPVAVAAPPAQAVDVGSAIVLRKPSRLAGPILWMLLGAALASAAFLLASASRPATPGTATAPPTSREALAPAGTPEARRTEPPAEPPAAKVEAQPEASPPAPVFDPQLGGERALMAARACFAPKRISAGLSFGLGLVYAAETGLSRKVYLPADELEPAERSCLGKALVGIDPGAPPARATVVDYRFHIRGDRGEVKIHAPRSNATESP